MIGTFFLSLIQRQDLFGASLQVIIYLYRWAFMAFTSIIVSWALHHLYRTPWGVDGRITLYIVVQPLLVGIICVYILLFDTYIHLSVTMEMSVSLFMCFSY